MPANTTPIFPLTPKISWGTVLTADGTATKNHDGTAAGAVLLFTAGANGSIVNEIKATPLGTNVASALRIFINNGSANTTAANNALYSDAALPAITIAENTGQSSVQVLKPDDNKPITLPAGYKLYACVGTTMAIGWHVAVVGGDY
ncbi:hypothetical protein LPY66_18130 [Dehalobacter sp. DCM]|uniref:hypothetical protein n=1 Tax=Dehalobacter sp. DCM TaxID=2907827 RepID=UPI003081D125|nr:hypothetical protein LPY66_18130 [Dehalobacter sp. DCM]